MKKTFRHVQAQQINLGMDESNEFRSFKYIPVTETLMSLFQDESIRHHYLNPRQNNREGYYCDISSGEVYQKNPFFNCDTHAQALQLILFQDAFEVVNPLGSAKKKHKILGVYLSCGNIYPENRSTVDVMQLILLCKESDFKYFGQEKIFAPLLRDLKYLEETGIDLGFAEKIKASVVCITGDNLGSHCIGGFVENFSTAKYMCRYCLISIDDLRNKDIYAVNFEQRTPANYQESVALVEASENMPNHKGIKFDSVFNSLSTFHVCTPGLPPCLGHDLFEGVVKHDVKLILDHLIKDKQLFSFKAFNVAVKKFSFKGSDLNSKPNSINENADNIGGHAMQNWCLLRFMPLIVCEVLNVDIDDSDSVFNMLLLLHEIVEIVVAQAIDEANIASLSVLVECYLTERSKCFPNERVRPKHHYLTHYPELIQKFGPLIHVWGMRFESKHAYFKQCVRTSKNFINVAGMLAEKHQLLQAYYTAGTLLPDPVEVKQQTSVFEPDLYKDSIRDGVRRSHLLPGGTFYVSNEATLRGQSYKNGMVVIMKDDLYKLIGGKIMMILSEKDETNVTLVVNEIHCIRKPGRYFEIKHPTREIVHVTRISDLYSWYPLQPYRLHGLEYIVLKQRLVDVNVS